MCTVPQSPFDRWTMDDYYSFAAFFSQIGRKNAEDPREVIVYNRRSGDMKHMVDGRVMEQSFLVALFLKYNEVLIVVLYSQSGLHQSRTLTLLPTWQISSGNTSLESGSLSLLMVFVSAIQPRTLNCSKPCRKFTEYNYDFKRLVRDICNSQTYQRTTRTNESNESDTRNFSHGNLRRLRAEVLLDVITQVTQTKNKFEVYHLELAQCRSQMAT